MLAGAENTEEIKQGYEKRVIGLEQDVEYVRRKIEDKVLEYTDERILTQNLDLAFRRIVARLQGGVDKDMKQLVRDWEHIKQEESNSLLDLKSVRGEPVSE